jgi:hypothetical protein
MGGKNRRIRKKHNRHSATPSASVLTTEKRNITVLSLDYDGCAALLFEEALEKGQFKNECDPGHKQYLQGLKSAIHGARTAFEDLLSIETTGADIVELCVGSTRQTRELDRDNNFRNKNGLCFEMYADLAEKKHWYFNKMLIADFIDDSGELRAKPLKPGTAMGRLGKNKQGMYKYEKDTFADTLQVYGRDPYKTGLLSKQIKAIVDKYPNDKIRFVFVDDRLDIMQALQSHFNPETQCSLYSNVENVELKLIHHNYHELLTSRMNAEQHPIIDAAKKIINGVATLPVLNFNSINKKSQEAIISQGLFSKSIKIHKATEYAAATNYGFICKALGLIGCCLVMLTVGGILFVNTRKSDNELPDLDCARDSMSSAKRR